MVGIILKNFFLSSHSKQFSFHRPMLTVCAHQTLPMKRSLCYFGEYPTQIVIIYHRLDNSVFLPSSLQLGGEGKGWKALCFSDI